MEPEHLLQRKRVMDETKLKETVDKTHFVKYWGYRMN